MSNEPELLPCPLCGGEASIVFIEYYHGTFYMPACDSCYCKVDAWHKTKEEAAAAWNRRDWRPEDKPAPPRIEPMATP